jgi:hypothetical protein
MGFIFLQILSINYIGFVRPMRRWRYTQIEMFNEYILLILSYLLIFFTDYIVDADIKYYCGWGFIGLVIFNILINERLMFLRSYSKLKRFFDCFKKKPHSNKMVVPFEDKFMTHSNLIDDSINYRY